MVKIKTFSSKVREDMAFVTSGYCEYQGCFNKATEFHHKFANTLVNNKKYPLFIQSPFNCFAICNDCHMTKPKVKINENLVKVYEEWLNDLCNRNKR